MTFCRPPQVPLLMENPVRQSRASAIAQLHFSSSLLGVPIR
jgi:hypothetical protein